MGPLHHLVDCCPGKSTVCRGWHAMRGGVMTRRVHASSASRQPGCRLPGRGQAPPLRGVALPPCLHAFVPHPRWRPASPSSLRSARWRRRRQPGARGVARRAAPAGSTVSGRTCGRPGVRPYHQHQRSSPAGRELTGRLSDLPTCWTRHAKARSFNQPTTKGHLAAGFGAAATGPFGSFGSPKEQGASTETQGPQRRRYHVAPAGCTGCCSAARCRTTSTNRHASRERDAPS